MGLLSGFPLGKSRIDHKVHLSPSTLGFFISLSSSALTLVELAFLNQPHVLSKRHANNSHFLIITVMQETVCECY